MQQHTYKQEEQRMSVSSVGNSSVSSEYHASMAREKAESKAAPDHDHDADDSAKLVSKASSPSVNASGSVVGSVVNVKV